MSVIYVKDKNGMFVQIPTIPGKSAYEIAVERKVFTGTEQEFAEMQVFPNKEILEKITQENIDNWNKGMTDEEKEQLDKKFDDVVLNEQETTDMQIALDFLSNGEVIKTVYFQASSGGGGVASAYISTTLAENVLVGVGEDFSLLLDFVSPNLGRGTLRVFINDVDVMSTSIGQGESTTVISEKLLAKGTNRVVIYVLDRVGQMSNSLTFYVRYGSTELTSDFDVYSAYDYGAVVRYYFTPTALDTSYTLTFYMSIDGAVQQGVPCTSDTRGYYTFPSNLSADSHYCEAWVEDSSGGKSNVLKFNLIILNNSNLVVASDTKSATIEEGVQLVLDYKAYMRNAYSFITKTYVDNVLVNTGTCGLETAYYRTSSLKEGTHTIRMEVWDITETISDYVTWTITITESTYEMLQPITTAALFVGSAINKTNSDERKEVWVGTNQDGQEVLGNLYNFAFNNESGWVNDNLIISGNSHVEIPIQPLANNARYGFTLDIEFLSKQIGVENAEVLTLWNEEKNCGIRITTENLILRSAEGNECNLYFSDNEKVNAMFVIDRNEAKAKIYLNGVMCEAFHLSDYTANGVPYLEDFTVNSNIILGGLNKNGYSEIRNLRVYQVALTTDEILNNFMANEIDKTKQQQLVEFQKGSDLPTLTIYCDFSGLGKDDKKPCSIVYNSTDETKYGKSFTLNHKMSTCQYQGTSSMAYPIKNYRINLADENGEKWRYDFPYGKPEYRFTLKADFMNSCHAHNTGLTKWINDNLYNYDVNDENSMNPKKWYDINNGGKLDDTRECIYGFPCRLILVNDGNSPLNEGQNEPTPGNTKDMGIFNFNHDKDATDTMGFDQDVFSNCASYEVTANSDTSAGAFMSYTTVNPSDMSELDYIKQSFEMRFPDAEDVSEGWGFMGVGEEGTGLKALIDWVDGCTDEEFVRDFEQHFHKDYTFRYYLLVITLGMVDNLGKNMMLDTWDNKIFMPRFYDCDTILSYDNSGDIKFDVDIEMEQGYWNTSSSRLWTRIRDLFHNELIEKYNNMRQNGLSYESLMKYFYDEQIAKIPQKYYNMDYDIKYAPFADSYIGMAHGDGYEHMKHWLKNRLIFTDTLFDYAPSYNNDMLTIRANTTEEMTIYIETYTPVYQHLSWYNGQMDKKKVDGKIAVSFSGKAMAETDQEVLIYGGSNIKRITGIASMNPNQMLIGSATRLIELDASNCPLLADINSNKANLSPHTYLNKLNLNNCPQLGGTLRLNNSPLIQEIDIRGTAIIGTQLSSSIRNLEVLRLPNTITDLTLNDAGLLHTLEFSEGTRLQNISMTNCNALTNVSNFDIQEVPSVYLDNSYNSMTELYANRITDLTLRNMPNLERVIFIPNDEYEIFNKGYLATRPNYKVSTFNLPKCNEFLVTAPQRLSYNLENEEIQPNTVFSANSLDLSETYFTDVKLLSTTDINTLELPRTIKNFIADSAYDIDTNVIEDATFEVIHNELIQQYTEEWNEEVLLNGETPNIIPSSSDGSIIYSINSDQEGVWDLDGLEFDNFYTYGMNNDVKLIDNNLTMPERVADYNIVIKNANIKPKELPTMLYPLLVDETNPIEGTLDYSNYIGTSLDYAFAYTKRSQVNRILPIEVHGNAKSIYRMTYNSDMVIRHPNIIAEYTASNNETLPNFNNGFQYTYTITELDDGTYGYVIMKTNSNELPTRFDFNLKTNLLTVEYMNISGITNMRSMFYNCYQLKSVNSSDWDTSNVTDMSYTFWNNMELASVDVSEWNTSKVTNMTEMFGGCTSLTSLDVSNWETSNVTDMSSMFRSCTSLTSLDVSNWKTPSVTNMKGMFNNCRKLISLDLSNFDTSKVIDFSNMFAGCWELIEITGNLILNDANAYEMFFECTQNPNIDNLTLSGTCTNTYRMFYSFGFSSGGLAEPRGTSINLSNITLVDVGIGSYMFSRCNQTNIYPPQNITVECHLSNISLTREVLLRFLNNLAEVTTNSVCTLGTTNINKLTEDDIAIAINKGWTVE